MRNKSQDCHQRLEDIKRFYALLDQLKKKVGGCRYLENAHGRMDWPERGVYFFYEPGERLSTSDDGGRVVRVGTHALIERSSTTIWNRLRQHRGTLKGSYPGGGNHRGSIFRLHVGTALIAKENWSESISGQWGVGSSAKKQVRKDEYPLEKAVSNHIRKMPFLWIAVNDKPGPNSLRAYIESNAIALLSNYSSSASPIDPSSGSWLGHWAKSDEVSKSGLWNVNHVTDKYDPNFLLDLKRHIDR